MKIFYALSLLWLASGLYAIEGAFIGMGAEANANTRSGAAVGGSLVLGLDLTRNFALGLKTSFSHNTDTVGALEPQALVRFQFPVKQTFPYVQAEIGCAVFFEDGGSYPAFLGGLGLGWRFHLGRSFYLEPSVRGGYPFAWGAGLNFGFYFNTLMLGSFKR